VLPQRPQEPPSKDGMGMQSEPPLLLTEENIENSLRSFVPLQDGHSTCASVLKMSFSNLLLHVSQAYS
jgi:hypothetical protein